MSIGRRGHIFAYFLYAFVFKMSIRGHIFAYFLYAFVFKVSIGRWVHILTYFSYAFAFKVSKGIYFCLFFVFFFLQSVDGDIFMHIFCVLLYSKYRQGHVFAYFLHAFVFKVSIRVIYPWLLYDLFCPCFYIQNWYILQNENSLYCFYSQRLLLYVIKNNILYILTINKFNVNTYVGNEYI